MTVPRIDPIEEAGGNPYRGVLARRPEIAEAWAQLGRVVRFTGVLPPALKEEVRRATAEIVGCRFCASFGDVKAEHDDPREELAVRFARTVAKSPALVDDDLFDELRRHFSEEEIVELVAMVAFVAIGGQTFGAATGIEPASDEYARVYEHWLADSMAGRT